MMLDTPCWVFNERSRTAGAAAGISGRVAFAACWAGMPIKAFAKIATPRFRKDLMIMAGFGYPVVNIKGDVRYEAKSMSFASMSQDEFEALYSRVVDVVLQRVLSNYTRDDLERVVSNVLGFV